MELIDKTYFEDADLLVPGLEKETQENKLNELITKYEPEYLQDILGYSFYKTFKTAVEAGEAGLAQRWKDLRDGADYTDAGGVLRKWEGFANAETMRSPIANYVYYRWLRYNVPTTTVSGEKTSKAPKSVSNSSVGKQTAAWNEMVRMNRVLFDFLLNKKDDNGDLVYPEFKTEELGTGFANLTTLIGTI